MPTCDVVCQETIRLSQAEFVDPKFPGKSTETTSSTSTLGGQQNKGKDAGAMTGLIGSFRVLQNKSKPKMVKPKKPDIGVWKTVESKSRHKHQKEKPKLFSWRSSG